MLYSSGFKAVYNRDLVGIVTTYRNNRQHGVSEHIHDYIITIETLDGTPITINHNVNLEQPIPAYQPTYQSAGSNFYPPPETNFYPPPTAPNSSYQAYPSESEIKRLVDKGYSIEKVFKALNMAKGDVEIAESILKLGSF